MKCPSCGYLRLEETEACPRCGQESLPRPPNESLASSLAGLRLEKDPEVGSRPRESVSEPEPVVQEATEELVAQVEFTMADHGPASDVGGDFDLDDEIIPPSLPAPEDGRTADRDLFWMDEEPLGAVTGRLDASRLTLEPDDGGVVERAEDVPERFWAPEGASMPRRIAALLADQALLGAVLAIFSGAAFLVLRVSGLGTGQILSAAGMHAALGPLLMLAVVLSLCYHTCFHVWSGCTPGKALAAVEVRTIDGGRLSWGRALMRWFAGLLSLAPAGAGFLWSFFEPRRRGWTDLLSGTVLGDRRRR